MVTDLSKYNNAWFNEGASFIKRTIWHFTNAIVFKSALFPVSGVKCALLRLFGAKIGKGVVIKPSVNIKYPWKLTIADYSWIGENVWIDNLETVTIGKNCCISQGAMLLCGNHNYTTPSFELIVKPITLEDGVWISAQSIVSPGTLCRSHSVLSALSLATGELNKYTIYRGNPAIAIKERTIKDS